MWLSYLQYSPSRRLLLRIQTGWPLLAYGYVTFLMYLPFPCLLEQDVSFIKKGQLNMYQRRIFMYITSIKITSQGTILFCCCSIKLSSAIAFYQQMASNGIVTWTLVHCWTSAFPSKVCWEVEWQSHIFYKAEEHKYKGDFFSCPLTISWNLSPLCVFRLFGVTGNCAACSKLIPAFEMVMRAKDNVYHLDCFACQLCNQR